VGRARVCVCVGGQAGAGAGGGGEAGKESSGLWGCAAARPGPGIEARQGGRGACAPIDGVRPARLPPCALSGPAPAPLTWDGSKRSSALPGTMRASQPWQPITAACLASSPSKPAKVRLTSSPERRQMLIVYSSCLARLRISLLEQTSNTKAHSTTSCSWGLRSPLAVFGCVWGGRLCSANASERAQLRPLGRAAGATGHGLRCGAAEGIAHDAVCMQLAIAA
jgi:hypothetical protein